MKFEVAYTDNFEHELKRLAKKFRSLKASIEKLIDSLETEPFQGTAIGKDCYKIRLAIPEKGRGKSGGARLITHVFVSGQQVYLLSIFDKSEKDNLTDKEIKGLLSLIKA